MVQDPYTVHHICCEKCLCKQIGNECIPHGICEQFLGEKIWEENRGNLRKKKDLLTLEQ